MKRFYTLSLIVLSALSMWAQDTIHIQDPATWSMNELKDYVGRTVVFDCPMIVSNNSSYGGGGLTIGPRRTFSPTNQAYPRTSYYNDVIALNNTNQIKLSGASGYHRLGEKIYNLKARVNSVNSLDWVSGEWRGNTRDDMYNINWKQEVGDYSVLVCTANLEYYLTVPNTDPSSTMGPHSASEHQAQRTKVSKGLAKIAADVYGFVEIEAGDSALAEIARDLTKNTGKKYAYIHDGTGINGTYTKSGFVYCTETIEPIAKIQNNGTVSNHRSQMQCFREIATGETFLMSENHFKAKSGSGSGLDANQGDGQGQYNYKRTQEAQSVVAQYKRFRGLIKEKDIIVMGDLNAYAMEDPITVFIDAGFTDLHRAFHADSSYSYVFGGQAGYLDHAIVNSTMLPQVTGMTGYHINSDESDDYTYDKSSDRSMFRYSDHDPVVVGLRLESTPDQDEDGLTKVNEVRTYDQFGNLVTTDERIPGMLYFVVQYGINAKGEKIYIVTKTLAQ